MKSKYRFKTITSQGAIIFI